jgi:hypothetical protein
MRVRVDRMNPNRRMSALWGKRIHDEGPTQNVRLGEVMRSANGTIDVLVDAEFVPMSIEHQMIRTHLRWIAGLISEYRTSANRLVEWETDDTGLLIEMRSRNVTLRPDQAPFTKAASRCPSPSKKDIRPVGDRVHFTTKKRDWSPAC